MEMDFNMAFAILNIKMTKDESLIRSAYRMALPANHPEDNPEGFKLLREAYEKALEYSHILAYVPEQEDNTPIGALQKKIEGIYQSISARIRCESWKDLLREDVFDDLDYYEEAKWELFTFLQQNYRVPREIYQLSDERFEICKYAQEFKEKLSDTFVDYMISNVNNENYGYSYEWFHMLEGRDDADYDAFLSYVQELEGSIQIEDLTRAGNLIRTIDAMGIWYPYYTLDKADYFIAIGENEEAKAIALELADVETYLNNVHIQMRCGEVLWRVGEKEKAYVSLCQSLALSHENYIGNKYAALYEMEHGELKKALSHIYVNRIFRDDEELYIVANQLEQELIALCEQNTEPMESEDARLLAYAYRYQGELDKAIAVITSEDSYEKEINDYHMFLFELYQQKQDYPMALKHGKRRLECIREKLAVLETGAPILVDETKESLMHNLSDSNLQLGLVLMSYAKNERVKLFQEAIPFLIAAWEAEPENIVAQMNLAHCYLEIMEFQKTYEVYDALISRLGEQSGLLLLKQKLCYEMGRLQEVVVLYYQMLNQGAQDAQNLNTKDYHAELYYIKALSAAQFQENKRRHLLSAIEVNDRKKYHNTLAELYVQSGKPQEALNEYVYIEEHFTPDTDLYIEMAERYFDVDDIEYARVYVQKVIDLDPENENVYRTAAMIYDDFGSGRGIFYHDSIRLWKQYIAYNPEEIAFAYVRCGMAHLCLGQYQEALFCFTESENAMQGERKYDICVMFGRAYNGLGRYEEAVSYMEQGLAMMKEKDKTEEFAYQAVLALGHIYMRLGKLDAADETIRDYMEYYYTLEKKAYAVMTLKDMYVSAGLYEKAVRSHGYYKGYAMLCMKKKYGKK